MNNSLITYSKDIYIDLNNYHKGHATFQGYTLSDDYVRPDRVEHGRYRIIIESSIIKDEEELYQAVEKTWEMARSMTLLAKCVFGEAINTPEDTVDSFTKRIVFPGEMPIGWKSNYVTLKENFDKAKTLRITARGTPRHFFVLKNSPFEEIVKALKEINKLTEPMKDLLVIMNDVDLITDSSRYMLLGKALEIVDAMYPLNHKRIDNRIRDLFPEIADKFNGMTLKSLIGLSNTRKESRHYINVKSAIIPHQGMTYGERKDFYYYSNLLCLNLIRKALGLQPFFFEKPCKKGLSQIPD